MSIAEVAAARGAKIVTANGRGYLGEFFDRTTTDVGCTTKDLRALTIPTLLLTGDRDIFCPVEIACAAYRALPASELGIVPKTGHDITPSIIQTMIRFLSEHS